jgi:hypothetical protein
MCNSKVYTKNNRQILILNENFTKLTKKKKKETLFFKNHIYLKDLIKRKRFFKNKFTILKNIIIKKTKKFVNYIKFLIFLTKY